MDGCLEAQKLKWLSNVHFPITHLTCFLKVVYCWLKSTTTLCPNCLQGHTHNATVSSLQHHHHHHRHRPLILNWIITIEKSAIVLDLHKFHQLLCVALCISGGHIETMSSFGLIIIHFESYPSPYFLVTLRPCCHAWAVMPAAGLFKFFVFFQVKKLN